MDKKRKAKRDSQEETEIRLKRSKVKEDLLAGKLEDEWVTVEVTEQNTAISRHDDSGNAWN